MNVVLSSQPAARGLGSMQSASLDQELTDWIIVEETWKEMASACLADKFKGGVQPGLKREEYGYVRATPPVCTKINKHDASKACRYQNLRRFMQSTLEINRDWLAKVTDRVRAELQHFPKAHLGEDGCDFMKESLDATAFAYVTPVLMKPGARRDGRHFDGGASILHAAFTGAGGRDLECILADGTKKTFSQSRGSFYVGNMCTIEREVVHESKPNHLFSRLGDCGDVPL